MNLRDGSHVPTKDEHEFTRRTLMMIIKSVDKVSVGGGSLEEIALGFTKEAAERANRAFTTQMHALSEAVAEQQPDAPDDLDDLAYQQELEKSLKVSNPLPYLIEFRKLGAGLRGKLSEAMTNVLFQYHRFFKNDSKEDPALLFVKKIPFLWEMMYEGSQTGTDLVPDWQKFWGFRTPITHWCGQSRTEELYLQHGFFSAINEDLDFASREVDLLVKQLPPRLPHMSLTHAFREKVKSRLRDSSNKSESEIKDWCKQSGWLSRFLEESQPNPDIRALIKQNMLVEILKESFQHNLIHFACHCEAGIQSQLLTRLDIKVAGEEVPFEASLLSSDLKRDFDIQAPGPLVFLNACGTSQQSDHHEPPLLPEGWIKHQGALAVVATICPVPDYFAHAFARKFYEFLLEFLVKPNDPDAARRRHVREALLDTRRHFMEKYDNPLGLAYVLYAYSDVRILADFMQTGGEP